MVPHNWMLSVWRLSVFDSDLPDFPDTGDPDFCFKMPRLRDGFRDVESDYDCSISSGGGGGAVPGL